MIVDLIKPGPLAMAPQAVARFVAKQAIGRIKRRTARGVDVNGKPFASYSLNYSKSLIAIRESLKVDLSLTGGMLRAIHVVREEATSNLVTITLGFRPTTSPRIAMPPSHWGDDAIQDWIEEHGSRARRTGERGPAHPTLASWIHRGTTRMPARPFFGLSQSDRRAIRAALLRWNKAIVRSGAGVGRNPLQRFGI